MSTNSTKLPLSAAHTRTITSRRAARAKHPSDDEILGLVTSVAKPAQVDTSDASEPATATADVANSADAAVAPGASNSGELAQILAANPQLRDTLEAAQQFRAIFPTPAAAQDAKSQLDELDANFFSGAPTDHAALAARIHELSPEAFHGLANAMQAHAEKIAGSAPPAENKQIGANSADSADKAAGAPTDSAPRAMHSTGAVTGGNSSSSVVSDAPGDKAGGIDPPLQTSAMRPEMTKTPAPSSVASATDGRGAAQLAFFHSTNATAVQTIVASIEAQVNHLLPESVSAGAKTRIVGEIYRDLEATLRANQQLGKQLRDAFASASNAAAKPHRDVRGHQQAIVALVTGRAKQALPSIAKRVINEWTHGVVAANRERLARHESAAKRVDISGAAASDGVNRKPVSPRQVDYKRLSDSDILNL